jgi:hypothetical protein
MRSHNNASQFFREAFMQQSRATTQQTLRFLRIVHGSLMSAVLLYLYVMRLVPAQPSQELDAKVPLLLGVVALVELAVGASIRSRKLRTAFETLRKVPDDVRALGQWRQGVIISDSLAMAVVLFGVALHFLGAPSLQVASFFAVGAVALLLWWPRQP